MSRIGKQPIPLPAGVSFSADADGSVTITGPRGVLMRRFRREVSIAERDGSLFVAPQRDTRVARMLWGTYAAQVKNMVRGVVEPFTRALIIEGVGFRAEVSGKILTLSLGFSHPVRVAIPEGITATVEKNTITISGIDKEAVGECAARIRSIKKPEPYKGKGIRYGDEVVRRKVGKKSA